MEAGVPGPSLVRVLGRAEVECDPEAGAATTLRECSGPRWAGPKIPDERHSEGEGSGQGTGEQPLQTVKGSLDKNPEYWSKVGLSYLHLLVSHGAAFQKCA